MQYKRTSARSAVPARVVSHWIFYTYIKKCFQKPQAYVSCKLTTHSVACKEDTFNTHQTETYIYILIALMLMDGEEQASGEWCTRAFATGVPRPSTIVHWCLLFSMTFTWISHNFRRKVESRRLKQIQDVKNGTEALNNVSILVEILQIPFNLPYSI